MKAHWKKTLRRLIKVLVITIFLINVSLLTYRLTRKEERKREDLDIHHTIRSREMPFGKLDKINGSVTNDSGMFSQRKGGFSIDRRQNHSKTAIERRNQLKKMIFDKEENPDRIPSRVKTKRRNYGCNFRRESSFSEILQANPSIIEEHKFRHSSNPLRINESLPFLQQFENPCFIQRLSTSNPYKDVLQDARLTRQQKSCAQRVFQARIENGEHLRLRCFPAFFVAGVQKCGTTELNSLIPLHKSITSFTIKENHWWNRGRFRANGGRRPISLEGYLDLFDVPAETIFRDDDNDSGHFNTITGDVSPALLWDQGFWTTIPENKGLQEPKLLAPHFIKQVLPHTKFIVMLRDPTERLFSDWLFFAPGKRTSHSGEKTVENFHETVSGAIQWFENCQLTRPVRSCFYDPMTDSPYEADRNRESNPWWNPVIRLRMGIYYIFLNDLLQVFDSSQVFVAQLEDFSHRREQVLKSIYRFLNLEDDPDIDEKLREQPVHNSNIKAYKRIGSMLPKTREMLNAFYAPYNRKLAELLNDSKYKW